MSPITTHILDTSSGKPAADVAVRLCQLEGQNWRAVGQGMTDDDGRLKTLMTDARSLMPGTYRLTFEVGAYFAKSGAATFYPTVEIQFLVKDVKQHYHVPLLLSPFGYSTYRGS